MSKFCKKCGAEIRKGDKVCNSCGAKVNSITPIIIVIVIILFSGCCCCGGFTIFSSSNSSSSNNISKKETIETENTSNNTTDKESSKTKYTPIFLYDKLGTSTSEKGLMYTLNDKAQKYLTEKPELFPTDNTASLDGEVDYDIEYKKIEKNANKYGDKLMYLDSVCVNQIMEHDVGDDTYISTVYVIDSGNLYNIYYIGELDDIYQGDIVDVYGLPLSMGSYSNVSGGTTLCPILAGSYIKKHETNNSNNTSSNNITYQSNTYNEPQADESEIYGKIDTKGGNIVGFSTSYVCDNGDPDIIKSNLENGLLVKAVDYHYSYGINWVEVFDANNGDYYGWIDENYIIWQY